MAVMGLAVPAWTAASRASTTTHRTRRPARIREGANGPNPPSPGLQSAVGAAGQFPCWLPFPTCQAAERTAPGGNRRRRLLPAGVLPVRCCPEPTAGRPREHSGPSGSRAACGPRQRHGKRARALRQCVTVEAARFPPRFGRRKRRPHGPQASSLLILIHDDRNRQKWLTPSGKSS